MGDADDRDGLYRRMGDQIVFHFSGRNVLAAADDDVFYAPGDAQ